MDHAGCAEAAPRTTGLNPTTWAAAYERSFTAGRDAVVGGEYEVEHPLGTGPRWGVSYLLRPPTPVGDELADLGAAAPGLLDEHCWRHRADALHFTALALERYRPDIPSGDPRIAVYASAMAEVAADIPPLRIEIRGLTLASRGVLACGYPVDDGVQSLRRRLARAVVRRGIDLLPAEKRGRTMWHLTLLHFAGPIADPERLVEWVAARRQLDLGILVLPRLELVRYVPRERGIGIVPFSTALLGFDSGAG